MKIAILTFFESENYGTVLQAYATQKYLEIEGHTAELLHTKRIVNGRSSRFAPVKITPTLSEKIRYKAVTLLKKKSIEEKSEKFKGFRDEHLRVSRYYDSEEKLLNELEDYDLFVSGGDQIWNPYHKVFSSHYMFDFLPDDKPRISYGSSFGISEINDDLILSKMKADLSKYRAIGIREQSGVSIVNSMGLKATQVLDPVFLMNEHWNSFITERPRKKKYCLVYALIGYPEAEKNRIAEFAKKRELEVVILPYNRQNSLNGFKKEFGLSPEQFLNYIAHAEYVFTNSFHGLAFSILFQKQFALLGCADDDGIAKRERLVDLLEQFRIGDRSFENAHTDIDYNAVNELMQIKLSESKKYIKENIEKSIKQE